MDPVSHAVLGRLAAAAVARPRPAARGSAAASILGALSPDVDFLLMPVGWDIYLLAHQVGTHTLAGAGITGLASAALVRAAVRTSDCGALAAAGVAGAWSHLIADVVSGATLRPAWPLSDAAPSVPLVAMADPWTMAVVAAAGATAWRRRTSLRHVSRVALLSVVLFLLLKGALLVSALTRTDVDGTLAYEAARAIDARWGSLTEWRLFDRTPDALRVWRIDARGSPAVLEIRRPIEPEPALVRASRALGTVRNLLRLHDLTFAIERLEPDSRRTVLWSDVRYCRPPRGPDVIDCALWFGGVFGPDGRVLFEQVHVGSWVQRRRHAGGTLDTR